MQQFLTGDSNNPYLGPLVHQYPWLTEVETTRPPASRILIGDGLGLLFIELTDRCNERCIHCYAESSPERSGRLELHEIRKALKEARGLGNPAVQFTGGDPLIHPDIVEAVTAARGLGYERVEIYTNGLALNDAMLRQLLPPQPDFAFSVYAHDAAVHDRITQVPGSLARTLAAVRRVLDAGLKVRIGIVLMPENRGCEAGTVRFLQDELSIAPSQIGLDVVRSTGRGRFMGYYQPDLQDLHGFGHRPDMPAAGNAPPGRRGKLCVSAGGNVYSCIFSRRISLGNIHHQSLAEIMSSLDRRELPKPSERRWRQCRQGLSCSDCRAIAYALGEQGGVNAAA